MFAWIHHVGLTYGMFTKGGIEIPCPDDTAGLYIKTRTGQIVKVYILSLTYKSCSRFYCDAFWLLLVPNHLVIKNLPFNWSVTNNLVFLVKVKGGQMGRLGSGQKWRFCTVGQNGSGQTLSDSFFRNFQILSQKLAYYKI